MSKHTLAEDNVPMEVSNIEILYADKMKTLTISMRLSIKWSYGSARIPKNARASKWNVHMVRCETKYEYYSVTINLLTVLTFDSDFSHSLAKVRKTNTSRVAPSPRGEENFNHLSLQSSFPSLPSQC